MEIEKPGEEINCCHRMSERNMHTLQLTECVSVCVFDVRMGDVKQSQRIHKTEE